MAYLVLEFSYDRSFPFRMPSLLHTVFVWLVEKYRDSTMELLPASETVVDGEGNVPIVRGRGKPLENGERMAILQVLQSKNLKLEHGAVGLVWKQFKVSRVTVTSGRPLWGNLKATFLPASEASVTSCIITASMSE
jgi:hypothetical protein